MKKIKKTSLIKAELWSRGKLITCLEETGFTSIRQIKATLRMRDKTKTQHQLLYRIWDFENNIYKEF